MQGAQCGVGMHATDGRRSTEDAPVVRVEEPAFGALLAMRGANPNDVLLPPEHEMGVFSNIMAKIMGHEARASEAQVKAAVASDALTAGA
jgi:hypothetical protein